VEAAVAKSKPRAKRKPPAAESGLDAASERVRAAVEDAAA
jgi:hypothetical protein